MPVLEVSALPQGPGVDVAAVSAALAEAVADVLGERPRGTWVLWRTLDAGTYSEHDDAPAVQPAATHPPLVRVTASAGRPPEVVAEVLEAIAGTLVRGLGLSEGNAMVRWDEVGPGRLHAGGAVVGRDGAGTGV